MKHVIALAVIVSMLTAVSFVEAAGRGKPKGYQGTISTLGSAGFAMTTDDGKVVDVVCNANTKVMNGKEEGKLSDVKEGLHVSIQGGMSAGAGGTAQIMATSITILPSKKK